MNKSTIILGLVLLISFSLAVQISFLGDTAKIEFDHYPVFNVSVKYLTSENEIETDQKPFALHPIYEKPVKQILSVSYDNSTWLELENKNLDQETGKLVLVGKTEDAQICLEGKKTGRDLGFWNDPNHCYTKVTAWKGSKKLGETFADEKGNWKLEIQLSPGENNIRLEASDPGSNKAEKTLKLEWNPSFSQKVNYYLSKPEYQIILGVFVFVIVLAIILVVRGEIVRAKRKKEIERNLKQLFEEERLLLRKLGFSATESQEYRTMVKKILLSEPFVNKIEWARKKYSKIKNDKEKLKAFVSQFEQDIKDLAKRLDPNTKETQIALVVLSTYVNVAKELLKE